MSNKAFDLSTMTVEDLFRAKKERRQRLARLPFEQKIEIVKLAAAELVKHNLGSVTVGVVSGATLVSSESYGLADMEKKIPASSDTVYRKDLPPL